MSPASSLSSSLRSGAVSRLCDDVVGYLVVVGGGCSGGGVDAVVAVVADGIVIGKGGILVIRRW